MEKGKFRIGLKKFLLLKKLKMLCSDISDLNGEEIVGTFYEKILRKKIKKSLELKKYSKEKAINYMQ